MRKVLVDLHRLGGNPYNGLYHYCYQLGTHLASSQHSDLDLFLYLPKHKQGIFGPNVRYSIQKSRDKFYRFGTGAFDIWHVATTLSWYRPFNNKTKIAYTIHDLNFLEEEEYTNANKKKYLALIQERVKRADHLTYISHFALKQAKQHLNVEGKPYTIIYNGTNIPAPPPYNAPTYQPSKPFLFSIGQLHARKNFHVLPSLLVGNEMELLIAGLKDFPYTEKVLEAARQHGVSDRVKLIGPINDNDKYWYYQHCEAFVFPSIGEGFGLPVLEAMNLGKPVFLSTQTSLPEVGGTAAYYFENFDPEAMQKVYKNGMHDFRTHQRAEEIKLQAGKFSWTNAARQYLELYRQMANSR